MLSPAKLSSAFTCHVLKAYVIQRNSLFKLKNRIKQLLCLGRGGGCRVLEGTRKAVVSLANSLKNHLTIIFMIVHKLALAYKLCA